MIPRRSQAELEAEYGDLYTPDEARAAGLVVPVTVADSLRLIARWARTPQAIEALGEWAAQECVVLCVEEYWPDEERGAALLEAAELLDALIEGYEDLVELRRVLGPVVRLEGPFGVTQWTRLVCGAARIVCPTVESRLDHRTEKAALPLPLRPWAEGRLLKILQRLLRAGGSDG